MKLFDVVLYKQTPFTDQNNAVYFNSKSDMDAWFAKFTQIKIDGMNIRPDTRVMRVPRAMDSLIGYNYLSFQYEQNSGFKKYAFITNMRYSSQEVTELEFLVDPVQTIAYGTTIRSAVGRNTITRQHLSDLSTSRAMLQQLNSNSDTIASGTNDYAIHQEGINFGDNGYYVLFTTSVDLGAEFGTDDKPLMETSTGQVYDHLQSPLNLYLAEQVDYTTMMKTLKKYPWIARNITQNSLIPKIFVDQADIELTNTPQLQNILKFKNNATSANITGFYGVSMANVRSMYGLNANGSEDYMLRYPYAYMTVENNQGQQLTLNFEDFIGQSEINLGVKTMFGYDNQISVYPELQLSDGENTLTGFVRGSGLGKSITWSNWQSIPTLIDSGIMARANSAYSRNLQEMRTLGGRVNNVMDPSASLADKFTSAMDLTGVGLGVAGSLKMGGPLGVGKAALGIGTRIADDHAKMQNIEAELEHAKISSPSIQNQNNANTFVMANNIFGLQIKFRRISSGQWETVKRYHKLFGFATSSYDYLMAFNMPVMNYVKMEAENVMPNNFILPQEVELLRTRFNAGIKFWKDNGETSNVFNQSITDNNIS